MGRRTSRSVFAVALCSGVAMVGASVQGLLGVDAELQRSVLAAQQTMQEDQHSVRVIDRSDCWKPHKQRDRV
jgi:hypothetical protein